MLWKTFSIYSNTCKVILKSVVHKHFPVKRVYTAHTLSLCKKKFINDLRTYTYKGYVDRNEYLLISNPELSIYSVRTNK